MKVSSFKLEPAKICCILRSRKGDKVIAGSRVTNNYCSDSAMVMDLINTKKKEENEALTVAIAMNLLRKGSITAV